MVHRLSSHVTEGLIQAEKIGKEEREIYEYGLECLFMYSVSFISIFVIGVILGRIWESLAFWILFMPLRNHAGGYHASSGIRCYFLTIGMVSGILVSLRYIPLFIPAKAGLIFVWAMAILIGVLAPIDTVNKPLDLDEIRVYGHRSRVILCIEVILCMLSYFLEWRTLFWISVLVISSAACSLVVGLWSNKLRLE